eukprot:112139_1
MPDAVWLMELYASLLLLVTILRIQYESRNDHNFHLITRSPYNCTPMVDINKLILSEVQFKSFTRFDPVVWTVVWLKPLEDTLEWPECWYQNVAWDSDDYPFRKRSRQLSTANRLLRHDMYCTGVDYRILSLLFDQDPKHLYRDLPFIWQMILKILNMNSCLELAFLMEYSPQLYIVLMLLNGRSGALLLDNEIVLMDIKRTIMWGV